MLNIFKLYDVKAFPFSILVGVLFFLGGYFATKETNGSSEEFAVSCAVVLLSGILGLFFLSIQNKIIANKVIEKNFDEEPLSLMESISAAKGNLLTFIGMTFVLFLINTTVIPAIGTMAGGMFQVDIMDFEFNILTLVINLILVSWYLIGLASVSVIDATFLQTFSYTTEFFFDNFSKMIGFVFVTILCSFLFSFVGVSLIDAPITISIPIKCLVFIYLFGIINALSIHLFANYANFEDEPEWDEE